MHTGTLLFAVVLVGAPTPKKATVPTSCATEAARELSQQTALAKATSEQLSKQLVAASEAIEKLGSAAQSLQQIASQGLKPSEAQAIARLLDASKKPASTGMMDWFKDYAPALTAIATLVTVMIAFLSMRNSAIQSQRVLSASMREDRRKNRYEQLAFFGNLEINIETNTRLYERFKAVAGLKEDERTLPVLLDRNRRIPEEALPLLDEILSIDKKIEKLFAAYRGVISDPALLSDINQAMVNYRLLRLAREGILKGNPEDFKSYVFPDGLLDRVKNMIFAIQAEIKGLESGAS